ncbi:hypothetical protein H5410_042686 [Solanum commersonii]|uniref:Uncharacterized protein n=1 Tax=Solanum commersonii TaxID=4109 RepID=A0A9J5XYC6_SOLCO|nr:hypothetical protein H5410_042686 [Solanum commersonii]
MLGNISVPAMKHFICFNFSKASQLILVVRTVTMRPELRLCLGMLQEIVVNGMVLLVMDLRKFASRLDQFADAAFELPKNLSSSLRYLSLESTGMFGNISEFQIFHLPNLPVLRLGQNPLLTGSLPNFNRSSSESILELDFFYTGISGKVPDSIENDFTGNVRLTISKLNKLIRLDLSSNYLRGSILEYIDNLTAITQLTIPDNSFTGNVPSTIGKLNKLNYLSLSSNYFEGSIPDIFANFSELSALVFDTNNFTGSFPCSIATLTRLVNLELQNNLLTGSLPSNIRGFQQLQALDLSFNYFTGTTPPSLFLLPRLVSLHVQHNQLTGKLPNVLKKSYLGYVLYRGIDLSYNKLQGEIPNAMLSTSMGKLDLSHNFLTGFEKQECGNNKESPLEHDDDDDSFFVSGFTWQAVLIGYGCGMIFGLLMGGLMFLLEKPKWFVNFAEDIAQQIAAKKRTRQKKRRQRRSLRMN